METSILIAKIISVIYLSFGIGLLLYSDFYKTAIQKMLDDSIFSILGGILAIIIGFVIIQNHNFWINNWTVLITIIGWIALIKGILLLAFPKFTTGFKPLFQSDKLYKFLAPLIIVFGLVFAYFGFYII
jgi:hypothetical protein